MKLTCFVLGVLLLFSTNTYATGYLTENIKISENWRLDVYQSKLTDEYTSVTLLNFDGTNVYNRHGAYSTYLELDKVIKNEQEYILVIIYWVGAEFSLARASEALLFPINYRLDDGEVFKEKWNGRARKQEQIDENPYDSVEIDKNRYELNSTLMLFPINEFKSKFFTKKRLRVQVDLSDMAPPNSPTELYTEFNIQGIEKAVDKLLDPKYN